MSLYKELKPEIKKIIKINAKKYPHSGRVLIAKLHLHQMYNELTIGDVRDLISMSGVNEYNWDVFDWKYGEVFFKNEKLNDE